jgi:hypothetical protein
MDARVGQDQNQAARAALGYILMRPSVNLYRLACYFRSTFALYEHSNYQRGSHVQYP